MNPFERKPLPTAPGATGAVRREQERQEVRSASASEPQTRSSGIKGGRPVSGGGGGNSGGTSSRDGGTLTGRSLVRILCNAGSGALEYTHSFIMAYVADHFRAAVGQRLSVGAYELLSNALNFGSVSSDIVLELIESDSFVGIRVSNEAIQARIAMLTEHLLKLRTNAEQTFLEELRRSVTGGIPRPMLGLARVTHEVGLTLDLQVQERRVSVTAQCRR